MKTAAVRLTAVLAEREAGLRSISNERSVWRYGPEKWSKREILGHLIDSAANNHQRFVRVANSGALEFTRYDADEWVARQRYHEILWEPLLELWTAYNRHLAHVLGAVPNELGDVSCELHFEKPVTLRWVARDYVDHMNHHLRQIFEEPPTDYGTISFIHPDER